MGAQTSGLGVVVELNEASKAMNAHAFEVRLRSLDALVRSVKAATPALASFREVSLQMRQWSDDLARQLAALHQICGEAVRKESAHRATIRKLRLLTAANERCSDDELKSCMERMEKATEASTEARRGLLQKLVFELGKLRQLGMMAVVLSRAAMIEAAAAPPVDREELAYAANEFGTHAAAVLTLSKQVTPAAEKALETTR